jgi:hypothetical protein
LYEASLAIADGMVNDFVGELKKRYEVKGVSDHSLFYAARASLAVERLAEEEGLGAVAIEDLNPEYIVNVNAWLGGWKWRKWDGLDYRSFRRRSYGADGRTANRSLRSDWLSRGMPDRSTAS